MGCGFTIVDGIVRFTGPAGNLVTTTSDGAKERMDVDIGSVSLNATQLPNEPPTGWIPWHVRGNNPDTDPSAELIWAGPTTAYTFQTSAATLNVVSTSAADDLGSTGAEKVTISGLASDYTIQTEEITMDGLTPVATSNSYIAFNESWASQVGSGGENAGGISFTHTGSSDVIGYMSAGHSFTTQAVRTVPKNYKFRLMRIWGSIIDTPNVSGFVALHTKKPGEGTIEDYSPGLSGSSFMDLPLLTARDYPEKTEIYVEWHSSNQNVHIHAGLEGWLIPTA